MLPSLRRAASMTDDEVRCALAGRAAWAKAPVRVVRAVPDVPKAPGVWQLGLTNAFFHAF
jgi:hypothetical protein